MRRTGWKACFLLDTIRTSKETSLNAFSKKVENHCAIVAIHFLYYNFGRIHKTLRVTPAMQAGLADHVWSLEEIVLLAN
jgi:hypothetical protein